MAQPIADRKKKEIRVTATISLGNFVDKSTKKTKEAYLTVYKDELSTLGATEVATTELRAVKIEKGKLKGRTIYVPIDDTSASGREFHLNYLVKRATGVGKKRVAAKYNDIPAYFPTWMTTKQIFSSIEKLKKKPSLIVTDLGTRVSYKKTSSGAID